MSDPRRPWTTPVRRPALACLAGLVAVGLLAVAVRQGGAVPAPDRWLHQVALHHRDGLVPVARWVTAGGTAGIAWPLIVLAALVFPRTPDLRARVGAVAVGALVFVGTDVRFALSVLVHRARPPRADWAAAADGFSFPSGHTSTATLAAGFLAWAVTRRLSTRRLPTRGSWSWGRPVVWALAVGYAVVVGWSRIWLGVHWPLDVLGGWLLASSWLAGVATVVAVAGRVSPGGPGGGPGEPVADG